MCPSERVALIEQKVRVSHVQGGHDHGPPLTERLAALKADDRMRRFVGRPVTSRNPEPYPIEPDNQVPAGSATSTPAVSVSR